MRITNTHGLPAPLVRAITRDYYHQPGHISATGLIQPPRIRVLMQRHFDEIEEDAAGRIWLLLGSAVHEILERMDERLAPELLEQRLSARVLGWLITGKPDLWIAPDLLHDYKITSVWATREGAKTEWEQQLNIYAHLYRLAGFPVARAQIVAIYRDWSKSKAQGGGNYPKVGAEAIPVDLWPDDEVTRWLEERVFEHQWAERLPDHSLPLCTDQERWARPTTYAVMKDGRKTAVRVLDTMDEAECILAMSRESAPKGRFSIVERPAGYARCDGYCPVKQWCDQYPQADAAEGEDLQVAEAA